MIHKAVLYGLACATLVISGAQADGAIIAAADAGWYRSDGLHQSSNTNYAAWYDSVNNLDSRDFFVFDLSSLSSPISGATLRLYTYEVGGPINYALYDVSTSIPTLTAGGANATTIPTYNDLGSGTQFSDAVTINSVDKRKFINIALNDEAADAINASLGGSFALGGDSSNGGTNSYLFHGSWLETINGEWSVQLITVSESAAVPEPATLGIWGGLALAGLLVARRRRMPTA